MAKAKKLPSGSWRVQVYAGKVDGKRQYKSFTASTARKAELAALSWQEHYREINRDKGNMTLEEAIQAYIDSRAPILSPSTITSYKRIRRNAFPGLMQVKLSKITQVQVDNAVVAEVRNGKSPKTIRNAHGLLSAVLGEYRPDFVLRTKLPQKKNVIYQTPDEEGIQQIIAAVTETTVEVPVLLALWLGLRMSEIRGLKWSSVHSDYLIIDNAIVDTDTGPAEKGTKTTSGTRKILLPALLKAKIDMLPHKSEYVIPMSGQAIYKQFIRCLEKNNLPHCRFHDLRHANASIMLRLGIPDKYAMERGGWSTTSTLKQVYQQTFGAGQLEAAQKIDSFYSNLMQHEMQHDD